MNMIPLIITVHATKIIEEISDTFTLSDYVVADGDIIEIKYPV